MDKLLNRSFVSIVIVQIASLFGDAVLRFALPLYVLNVTGSAALMGAVSAAAWLPYLVLTPIGGVAADRVNKRRIMAALDTLLALTCAAFLALDGTVDLVGLCICALIVLYAAQSVYQPTVQAAVPFVAPREGIVRATAIVSQISALSGLVGPVIGGLVFGLFGIEPVVAVAGAAFAVSAVLIVCVVRIPFQRAERSQGVLRMVAGDIAESFAFLRGERPVILKTILLVAGINLTLSAFIIIGAPVTVTQILGLPNQFMGFAEGALALGGHAAPGMRHAHEQREHHEGHEGEHVGEPPPGMPVGRVSRERERHRHADVVGERGTHDVPQVPDAHGKPRLLAGEVHGDDGGGHHAHHGHADALEHASCDELRERV